MRKYGISQVPILKDSIFVGSISDTYLFAKLIHTPDYKNNSLQDVMQQAFPIVDANTAIEEVAKKITKDNDAVLVKFNNNTYHIITKQDVINAIG